MEAWTIGDLNHFFLVHRAEQTITVKSIFRRERVIFASIDIETLSFEASQPVKVEQVAKPPVEVCFRDWGKSLDYGGRKIL